MALLDFLFGDAPELPERERVDVGEVQDIVQRIAEENARRSKELEAELDPELASLRPETYAALRSLLGDEGITEGAGQVRERFIQDLLGEDETLDFVPLEESELLQSAFDRAQSELALGGELPQDVLQQAFRASQERAGASGLSGGQAGRDITARDLGLTSLDLLNQRLGRASQLGQVEQGIAERQQGMKTALNQFNQGLLQARRGERASGLSFLEGIKGRNVGQALGAITSIREPVAGLDPGSAADIFVGDVNAENAYRQQQAALDAQQRSANQQFLGDLIGQGVALATAPATGGGSLIGNFFG